MKNLLAVEMLDLNYQDVIKVHGNKIMLMSGHLLHGALEALL